MPVRPYERADAGMPKGRQGEHAWIGPLRRDLFGLRMILYFETIGRRRRGLRAQDREWSRHARCAPNRFSARAEA
ncbi:hypothetical protein MESS2_760004 [Mesorhizobium metallidurans STM 2683]|uniref:Uncharacterized protein n=1 Tax=Mesorhizobium metallidurans STM 2683 TaxID=1297569 RepID=M5EW55_9HYPH|nr:hypothetical protein MESS2_760004 [Mesorhizobium metallidurans STM 2683]